MAECTIYDKLRYIQETKELIKTAIETQDVEVLESDAFRKYAEYITEIRKVSSVNGQQGDIILKTINGQDLVGEGDLQLQVEVDLSDYYNKEEVDAKIPDVSKFITEIPSEYVTETELNEKGYLTSIPDTYVTDEELSTATSDKVSQTALNEAIEGVEAKIPDVSNFITEIPSEYITESELNKKGYLTSIPDTYVTDEELSTATSDKVSQTALNEAIEGVEAKIPTVVEYTAGNGISMSEDNVISLKTTSSVWEDLNNYELRALGGNGYKISYRITGDETIKISNFEGSTNYALIGVNTDNVALKTDIPTNTSDLNNDSGFITESNLKTINGETIVGEGNITIQGGTGTINIVSLTQEEYDALTEYADNTFYVITDATETKIPTLQEGWQGNENNYVYSDYTDENHSVVSRASIGYAYYDDGIEIDVSNKLWGGMSKSERIKIAPVSEERMGFMTPDDKIKLDGLSGGNASVVRLTQAEYDALETKDDGTFYVITDASELTIPTKTSELTKDDVYTKDEIDAMIGGVSEKISEINNLL